MAAFVGLPYSIPGVFNIPTYPHFEYNGSCFTITNDGYGELEGNIRDAAYGILQYIIRYSRLRIKPHSVNNMDFEYSEKNISLVWNGDNKPEFFDELNAQFQKLSELIAFT
jgi:hypothetical protein